MQAGQPLGVGVYFIINKDNLVNNENVAPVLSASTWSGAFLGGVGAVTVTEWLAIGGFVLALAGFLVNFWHKRQLIKIERERLDREFPVNQ